MRRGAMAASVGAQVQGGVGKTDGGQSCAHRGATASPARCHFDMLSDELLLEVFGYASATELAALGSTARRFRQPTVLVPSILVPPAGADVTGALAPRAQLCSLVEAAARQHLQRRSALEQQRVPRRKGEPWLALMRELELLAKPVVFTDADEGVVLSHGGTVATDCSTYMEHLPVMCGSVAMRDGLHYVEMTSLQGCTAMYGVVGANFAPTHKMPAWKSRHGWMFGCYDGSLYHACTYRDWPGMQRTQVGDVVGLLLDLHSGSLAVYVNGTRLGLMVESGLRGPLYWVADLYSSSISGISTVRVGDARFVDVLAQAQLWTATSVAIQVVPPAVGSELAAVAAFETPSAAPARPTVPVIALPLPPSLASTSRPSSSTAAPSRAVDCGPLVDKKDCDSATSLEMQPRSSDDPTASSDAMLPPDWFDGPMAVDPNAFYTKWMLYAFLSAGPGVGIVWNWSNHCDGASNTTVVRCIQSCPHCPCYELNLLWTEQCGLCFVPGVYGLSLYIDVHGDPESWNCVGNLGILGLGWGVVASFHALRKVVRAGDGALAKLKVVNSSSSSLRVEPGVSGAQTSKSQLRLLSVRGRANCSVGYTLPSRDCLASNQFMTPLFRLIVMIIQSERHVLHIFAGGLAAKSQAMANGLLSVVRFFLRYRCGIARAGSLYILPADGTSSRLPWGLGHRRAGNGSIRMVSIT